MPSALSAPALALAALALATFSPAQASHTYSSDFGFSLSYPADWSPNILGPVLSADKLSLDKQSETDPYRRSIECSQNIFSARVGEPRSTFLIGVIATDCMGAPPDLDAFSHRTLTATENHYQLTAEQFGAFSVQGQKFWVMRSTGSNRVHPGQTETVEFLATALPKGILFVSAHALTPQAQAGFEHAHLHLSSSIDTELIPAGALDAKQPPAPNIARLGSASDVPTVIPYDTKASHHFDIGAGFTYEVPMDFHILNTEKWVASLKDDPNSPQSAENCSAYWLVATPEGNSRLVTVRTFAQKCLGYANTADNLPFQLSQAAINLAKKYTVHNVEYGTFTAGSHSFGVLRCTASLKSRAWEADRSLAIVLSLIPNGLVEFFLMGRSPAELSAVMATTLKLDDGAETALVPHGAFAHPFLPSTLDADTSRNPAAAHHFDSNLGFSLDLPPDMQIIDARAAAAEAKSLAAQQSLTNRERISIQCAQPILMAAQQDLSRILSVTTFAEDCIGYPLNASTLPTLGESGKAALAKSYELTGTEVGHLTAGAHSSWVMRAAVTPKDPTDNHRFLAVVLIPIEGGVAQCQMGANTQADLDALMDIPLKFTDGTQTTLIPADAFPGKP